LVVVVIVELRDEAAVGDLVIERLVRALEILDVRVKPLVVLEELPDVLRARLDVADELGAAVGVLLGLAPFSIADDLLDARRQLVDEALVRLSVRRLVDDDERGAAAGAAELVLERLEPGALARQELEELAAQVEVRRVPPRDDTRAQDAREDDPRHLPRNVDD